MSCLSAGWFVRECLFVSSLTCVGPLGAEYLENGWTGLITMEHL